MGEVVNVIVAFAVIVLVFKWATSGKESTADGQSPAAVLGFAPKRVTDEQIDTVHAMFPDIPKDNIRYDLLRTGNVEVTTNKVLERGFLAAPPPAYYTLYPRTPAPGAPQAAPADKPVAPKPKESLITRYHLEDRLADSKSAETEAAATGTGAGTMHVWQGSPEQREVNLRERKARMILAARERLLAQQRQQASEPEASTSS